MEQSPSWEGYSASGSQTLHAFYSTLTFIRVRKTSGYLAPPSVKSKSSNMSQSTSLRSISILYFSLAWNLPKGLQLHISPLKPCANLCSPSHILNSPSILVPYLIWSFLPHPRAWMTVKLNRSTMERFQHSTSSLQSMVSRNAVWVVT
jgi:hypothetical protein